MGTSITHKAWKNLVNNYFEPKELLSPDGMVMFNKGILVIQPYFLDKFVSFRRYLNRPFLVNHAGYTHRGWRSGAENQTRPMTNLPFHPMGVAADLTVVGMSTKEVSDAARKFGFRGVGLYGTFVHIDERPSIDNNAKYFWDNRK